MSEFLNDSELELFEKFLARRKISKAELARRLNKKPATAFYWFKKKRMNRLMARDFIKREKERALIGFDELEMI